MGYAGMGIIHPSTAPGDVSVNTVVDRSSTLLASTKSNNNKALLRSSSLRSCGNSRAFVIILCEVRGT